MTTPFGPSALVTPANGVTFARMLLTAPLIAMILGVGPSWPALVLWIGLAATDGVDGFLARRHGTTRSGAFLDPLADKVLVLGAMVALVGIDIFWWFPVFLIAAREIGIQGLRSYWGRRGRAVPASGSAKVKTVVQDVAVGLALAPPIGDERPEIAVAMLWLAVVLTLVSGAQYVLAGRAATTTTGSRMTLRSRQAEQHRW